MTAKPTKRRLNGVLLLDKPRSLSSNTALQQARRLYRAEKAGHTGVLDPLATGLLPVCFGEAAKFAQYLLDADKAYTATLRFGGQTDTGDAEGRITDRTDSRPDAAAFEAACARWLGAIQQIPPMYSALKHQGKALYEYARQGIEIERKARNVVIRSIRIRSFDPACAVLDIECSKGTYIRTLAEDIARSAGTLAHLSALRRTATAGFTVGQSHTLEHLTALDEAARDALLLPCDALVRHLPARTLPEDSVRRLRFGQTAPAPDDAPAETPLRAYAPDGTFVGLAHIRAGYLKALRLMSTAAD